VECSTSLVQTHSGDATHAADELRELLRFTGDMEDLLDSVGLPGCYNNKNNYNNNNNYYYYYYYHHQQY